MFHQSRQYVKTCGDVFLKIDVINFLFEHLSPPLSAFFAAIAADE